MQDLQVLVAELEIMKKKDVEYSSYANETQDMRALAMSYFIKSEIKSIKSEISMLQEEI
ncbi:hypothetical protein UFOVP1361_49 [uncultured Caudovirales phage]|uniref:Uncharacterized protein n=1 Tax=uncultured Caudovirales phage TaxID=2100421 RepID=A0A6J5S1F5_9CAUD|nr:hypothetical protein UFOVP1361_49 [uncultured Caudovirales phage]